MESVFFLCSTCGLEKNGLRCVTPVCAVMQRRKKRKRCALLCLFSALRHRPLAGWRGAAGAVADK